MEAHGLRSNKQCVRKGQTASVMIARERVENTYTVHDNTGENVIGREKQGSMT